MDRRKHFFALMCKYPVQPHWSTHRVRGDPQPSLEMSQRTCNENYDWAKRVEAERDEFERKGGKSC